MDEELVCAHPPRTFHVKNPGQYCSKACEKSGDQTTCACGHAGCGGMTNPRKP